VHGRCKQHLHRQPASTSQQRSAPAASAERPLPRPSQLQRRYPPPWPSGPRAMRRPLLTSRATGLLGSSRAAARLGAMRSSPRHSTGTRGRPLSTAAPTRSPCSRAGGRPGTAIVGKPVPPSRPHADTLTSPPPPPMWPPSTTLSIPPAHSPAQTACRRRHPPPLPPLHGPLCPPPCVARTQPPMSPGHPATGSAQRLFGTAAVVTWRRQQDSALSGMCCGGPASSRGAARREPCCSLWCTVQAAEL
jgi:hypothetical protein